MSGLPSRYKCNLCGKRARAWADLLDHFRVKHDARPSVLACDLVLKAERERLRAAGVAEDDLPVVMAGRGSKADRDAAEEAARVTGAAA